MTRSASIRCNIPLHPYIYGTLFIVFSFCPATIFSQTWSLFNGKDLSGWHVDVPAMDTNKTAINPFIVRNGMLVSLGTPNGHLISDSIYQNYRLNVEYRFAGKPGNCGVLVHASTPGRYIKCSQNHWKYK